MKALLITLITAYCLLAEQAYSSKRHFAPSVKYHDILASEDEPEYYKLSSEVELTPAEFQVLKKVLAEAISQYNKKVGPSPSFRISPLAEYGVQYKVALTKRGEKEVWINGFCKEPRAMYAGLNLTLTPVEVLDGGSCHFNTSINLKKRKSEHILIHGLG